MVGLLCSNLCALCLFTVTNNHCHCFQLSRICLCGCLCDGTAEHCVISVNSADTVEDELVQMMDHFSWLVDQTIDGSTVQETEFFSQWLVSCVESWGQFLDSPESFSQEDLESYIENFPDYRVEVNVLFWSLYILAFCCVLLSGFVRQKELVLTTKLSLSVNRLCCCLTKKNKTKYHEFLFVKVMPA